MNEIVLRCSAEAASQQNLEKKAIFVTTSGLEVALRHHGQGVIIMMIAMMMINLIIIITILTGLA